MAYQNTSEEAANSPLRSVTATQIFEGSYNANNFAQNQAAVDQEIAKYKAYKSGKATVGATISLEHSSALLKASGGLSGLRAKKVPIPAGAPGAKKRAGRKPRLTLREKVAILTTSNNQLRASNPAMVQVFDVVGITDTGTKIKKYFVQSDNPAITPKLPKNRVYIQGLPIASTATAAGRIAYAKAIQQLEAQGVTNASQYLGAFDQQVATRAAQMQVQPAAVPTISGAQFVAQPAPGAQQFVLG